VKLADDVTAVVRRDAELHSRSVAGQFTHWVRIGRAIEQSGAYLNDPANGVMRHPDVGYDVVLDCARVLGLNLPRILGRS
jgi:hypothetical protein